MATQNINIGVNVSDNGTAKKTVKNFEEITRAANTAQKAAANINTPAGGTQGSRAVYAKAAPTGSQQMLSGEEYGRGRGSMGATGASARDFANQAQGLGGLVRLYATFAANLFAASAAFTALKNAADTTNLVRGLNTLGAASGQSLGSLSKRLVEVTDGAVSMREAMEATAKASSAGMSSKDIERLGLVAKNASLALGVAMPDALSRISRGIVKLEPELLDELGLFTKIGPATEKYALEIGKSVGALTDFERRQAFANAVLTEGEKKFGALAEAAANPYDKLLSSLKNILSSGGELINKVLTPIISLLANSPTALAAVLTSIGYILLKQALPAIGQLRAGLRSTAEEALASAEAFKSSFGDEFQTILEKRFKIPDLEAGVKKAEADLAKLTVPSKLAPSVAKLAAGDEASLKSVEAVLKRKNALVETGMRGSKQASDAQIAAAKQEILYINAAIVAYERKQALAQGRASTETVADMPIGPLDPQVLALRKYEKLRDKVDQANAISNAAQVAGIAGVRTSWSLLNKEVAEKGITGFAKYSTLAQGGLAAIGTRIMGIVSAFGQIGQVVALGIAAFTALDGLFSKNAKQAETFNKALSASEESISNVSRTIQAATTVEGFGSKTIANTVALSNAFNELTTSAKEAIKTEKSAAESASGWDKFWNAVFTIAGKDRSSKLADSIAKQISSSIDILSREGLADEYANEIKKILNVTNLKDIDSVARAWKNLSKEQQSSVLSIQENSNRALGNASSSLQAFKDKTDSALTAYKTFTNSFVDTSPLFKLGEAYIDIGQSLTEVAAAGPNRIAQAFEELANNSQKAALFGKDFVKAFAPMAEDFKKQKAALDALNISLEKQTEARKNLSSASRVMTTESGAAIVGPNMGRRTREDPEIANENIRLTNRSIAAIRTELLEKGTKVLIDAGKKAVDTGLALINRSIANARATADINISKVLSSVLTGPRKLEAENQIRQRELKLQLEDVKISETLINIQSTLVDEMKLANALQAEANALQKGDQSAIERTAREAQKARAAVGQVDGIDPEILAQVEKQQKENEQRRTKGLQSKRIAITGEMQASTLGTQLQMPGATLQQQEQLAKITDRKLAADRASLDVLTSIAGVTSTTSILAKQSAEASALKRTQDSEIAAINADIEKTEKAKAAAKADDLQRLNDELKVLGSLKAETQAAQKAERDTTGLKNRQELLSEEIATIGRRTELERSGAELQNTLAQSRLDTTSQEFALYSSAYEFSRKFVISQQSSLDIQKAQLETSTAIAQTQAAFEQKRLEAVAKINALGDGPDADQKAKEIGDELARQRTITQDTVAGLTAQGVAKTNILNKTREVNLEQERYNVLLENSGHLATSLANVFGDLGTKLGAMTSAITEFAVASEKNAKSLIDLEKQRAATSDPKKILALDEEIATQRTKSTRTELAGNAKLAGSAKSLFKEKTGAYKVFAAVERGFQVASLALEIKTSLTKLGLWAAEVPAKVAAEAGVTAAGAAGAAARAPLTFGEIVGNYLAKIPPPFGMIAGVAAGAYFLSLLGKSGGGGSGAFVPNAEQRQETQGTAMGYDSSGNMVQVRRGVFGDTEAKSESIANSLELIRETSVDGLSYDNRMVALLTSIDSGINKTAKGLYGIEGLRTGSMFGTVQGTQSGGGLLGTGLFGSKTTRNITDSGLIIEGTFAQLASDTNEAVIDFFEQVTVSKKSWYGKTKTWVETQRTEIDNATSDFFRDIFSNATKLFIEVGSKAGISEQTVNQVLGNINLGQSFASLRGLKGEEFQQELSAIIGSILDDASTQIFTSFESYANFGEGMLETVIRVVDTNNKINQQIKNIGINLAPVGVAITEALTELAGGLDKFLDQSNSFRENFLTETERLVPIQKAVVQEMARLGFASVDTRAEFKALVQGLDLTTKAGQDNYQALMNVAEGFDTVLDYTEAQADALKDSAQGFRDFISQVKEFKNSILLGASSTLTPGEKYAEAKTQFDTIYAQALAGDKTAMGKVTSSAQTFLEASKTYFASSETYTQDFNSVLSKLDDATINAGASASVAELQLSALTLHSDLLSSINTNIATIAGVPAMAGGGRASGLTLVGEMGPELVDFTHPAQVYPASQTAGMFTGSGNMSSAIGAMVTEIKQLRQEVTNLRKDQQKQTGDIIISNYDAHQKSSEEIATAVADSSQEVAWTDRSKSEIK